jgi:hypothetical protein
LEVRWKAEKLVRHRQAARQSHHPARLADFPRLAEAALVAPRCPVDWEPELPGRAEALD